MKMSLNLAVAAATVAATFAVATPASAVIETFAEFSAIGTGSNVMWKNNGSSTTNGTGGTFYTTSTAGSNVAGARDVSFSFLQAALAPYTTDLVAAFSLSGTVTATPAMAFGGFLFQEGISGSFSFLTTAPLIIGSTTYAVGSNLLSGTFNQTTILGQRLGTAGSASASTNVGATITYTSDFLGFGLTNNRDLALSLTSIALPLQALPTTGTPNKALRTFKGLATGSFSSDPAPTITATIPEPAVWGLMLVGFGLVGIQTRRSRRTTVAA